MSRRKKTQTEQKEVPEEKVQTESQSRVGLEKKESPTPEKNSGVSPSLGDGAPKAPAPDPKPKQTLDLSPFFNRVIPRLQLAVVVEKGGKAEAPLMAIQQLCRKGNIPIKQTVDTMGDPALANLFRQSCAVVILSREKEEELTQKAFASGRMVISLNGKNKYRKGVFCANKKNLVDAIVFCKVSSGEASHRKALVSLTQT